VSESVTQFGDTHPATRATAGIKKMSEYYLADHKAAERDRQRQRERERERDTGQQQPKAADIEVTLLGDFMFPMVEPQGCDPYNSTHGNAVREAWSRRHERR
jgi:hypothetical protein